eukprot:CAMPEP_0206433100 /NCGR_PEP_ID=MMETSP0324_2-20121206/8331_1 /ASSEMBLY_ACC=CAM_ASM_000836 /TAXON_ID=2866 /ORGANISM="Crypthecodinium cohnii, Strain Seligo" /LENGTH=266 /DNA_ID=CAMNT_0053899299 /DNA_START=76 /DNA_END=876 /DNA_ORIENTATION=+
MLACQMGRPADLEDQHLLFADPSASAAANLPNWSSCPRAQEKLRLRIHALIPKTHSVELEEVVLTEEEEQQELDLSTVASSSASSDVSSTEGRGVRLRLEVVSETFENMRSTDRQRMVQRALENELASGAIHALPDLRTLTPVQWHRNQIQRFEQRLHEKVGGIERLEIIDLTDGHAVEGYFDGSGRSLDPRGLELQVAVVSSAFEGLRPLARHQLVQDALGPEILSGAIHALPHLKTWTPAQWKKIVEKAGGSQEVAAEKGCAKL